MAKCLYTGAYCAVLCGVITQYESHDLMRFKSERKKMKKIYFVSR